MSEEPVVTETKETAKALRVKETDRKSVV